ncbi:MAG: MmcQ/YjbR family DNA-binding protein [Acidobacteriota bacterium]
MTGAPALLEKLTRICLELPEATCEASGSHATFRARKKVFAYFLNSHHGDGIIAVTCKVHSGDNTALVQSQPERFYLPAYIGPRGWVGLRLDRGKVDWGEVKELVGVSYQLTVGVKRTASPRKRASRAD